VNFAKMAQEAMVREEGWDEWREGKKRRSAGGSEGRGDEEYNSVRRNPGWCGDRGRDCMDSRRRRSGWGAGRLSGALILQLMVLLLAANPTLVSLALRCLLVRPQP